jgi:dihydrofolate reductase
MRKLILSLHTTLDGFVAGPNGEMDWIKLDDELFDMVGKITDEADTGIYGRITYQMMESYWPTAADQPNATKHDIEHATWYKHAEKVVLSTTLQAKHKEKTTIISDDISTEIARMKNQAGRNMVMFGSPTAAHALMEHNLIDEYWLFVNPIMIGEGIPVFANVTDKIKLQCLNTILLPCGVTALHYIVVR